MSPQQSIPKEITARLQSLVESGDFKPGDRLPPERQLAVLFGVSRNSVREAIKSLEQLGVLESRPGAGTFLTNASQADLARQFGEIMARERHRLEDIFELRLLLEPQIAHLAARRITSHALKRLKAIMGSYELAMRDGQAIHDIDQAFHDAIAEATGNQSIVRLMEQMHDLLTESRDEALQSPARSSTSLEAHRRILEALGRHDAEGARAAMKDHLEHARDIVFTPNEGDFKL